MPIQNQELLKAQSPAALAEEYIVKSIWTGHFPAGSDLPAERELSDIIGVTRTTLREVLQRLARDGWLNIQHGKATRVNNIWKTAGPNIINTLIKLDPNNVPMIIANAVSLRTRMGEYYIPEAIKVDAEKSLTLFSELHSLADNAAAYAKFDYELYHGFAFIARKPLYALVLNSFKELYLKVATLYFSDPNSRQLSLTFYNELVSACELRDYQRAEKCMELNRQMSTDVWTEMLKNLPKGFGR